MLKLLVSCFAGLLLITGCSERKLTYQGLSDDMLGDGKDTVLSDSIIYHKVRVDKNGNILPWYSANPGESYDLVLKQVWQFWKNMEVDSNGQKYYMNHQVWRPKHDKRG